MSAFVLREATMKYNTNDPQAVAMREKMERLKNYGDVEIFDVISIEEVRKFEEENNIKLPDDYVWFITNVANGCKSRSKGHDVYDYRYSCGLYPLERTYFSSEYIDNDNWDDCSGEENFSLSISSTGCTGSYGIFLKGEHYGEISDNDEGLAYYEPKRVHGFKEWYNLLLDETLSGYSTFGFDDRKNHDIFSVIKQIFIPECYEAIAFELDTTDGIYFKDIRHIYKGVVDGAERYYPMIRKMLDYLAENESEYFKYAFRVAVMNPEFKASDIENIPNRDFVMKHVGSLYEEILIRRTEPYYTQAKNGGKK